MIDSSVFQGKKAAYFTLGCKLNFSETSTVARMLEEHGVCTVTEGEQADICLINTCTVTETANSKCRQQIRKMVRENPRAVVIVTGCYAQLSPKEVAGIDGVDLIVGSNEKGEILQFLADRLGKEIDASEEGDVQGLQWHCNIREKEEAVETHVTQRVKDIRSFVPSCSRGERTRYWLKVQDGCDYFCTYCAIPFARGNSRNPTIASLVAQARQAAEEGGHEIVLTGVNIGDFGKSTNESFLDLVKALDEVEGIKRYRISSLEPDLLSDDLIEYCAHSRAFMPHFHVPLQSGSDAVLKLMHRHYDTSLFRDKILHIKSAMPDAFIGVDVMVGCRGETAECFDETYRFLDSLPVTQLHVFPYSERPGTAALKIPLKVGDKEKKDRSKLLLELSDRKTEQFYAIYNNKVREVLFESSADGRVVHGFTDNYIRVGLRVAEGEDASILENKIMPVRLKHLGKDKMICYQ